MHALRRCGNQKQRRCIERIKCGAENLPIDLTGPSSSIYCERTSPVFWAEPFNVLTSLLVIFAAIAGYVLLWRRGLLSPSVTVLMVLAGAIGVGSFLLHGFATKWAEMADVIPIWTFVMVYGVMALRRFAPGKHNLPLAGIFGIAIFGSGVALAVGDPLGMTSAAMTESLSGTAQYAPAAVMVATVIWVIWRTRHPSLNQLGLGIGLFALALVFRSLDMPLCERMPTGTHFMWHLTNCLVFWHLIHAYALHGAAQRGA